MALIHFWRHICYLLDEFERLHEILLPPLFKHDIIDQCDCQ